MTNLSPEDKNDFLQKHLQHRLTLLRTLRERSKSKYNYLAQGDVYRCVKDSNLIAVRLLMDFMGLKGMHENGNYKLISILKRHQNDVKIDQFIGHLILPETIPLSAHRILAGVYVRADKELAHLTSVFNDEFNEEDILIEAATIIETLLKDHLYDQLNVQLPEMNL